MTLLSTSSHPLRAHLEPVLDPSRLSETTEAAVRGLMQEGESANTVVSYRSALRYWAAWFGARYGERLQVPVPVPVLIQFIVDHAQRATDAGLTSEMPPAIDAALVASGYKGKIGAPAFNTLVHRISVLSKAHQLAGATNPCGDALVRELLSKTRRAYAKRGALPRKQLALSKEPLEAMLETCDGSAQGVRDRALLLFAWSTGGRRRSEVASATLENLRKVGTDGYVYTMGYSKTNQSAAARPEDVKPLVGMAAQAMQAWLALSGITGGSIFRRIRKGGHIGESLAPAAVRDIVKRRCHLAGIDGEFSAHSLRSGFVTEAGRQNVSLGETMAMTGHRSIATIVGYFRSEANLNGRSARLMDSPTVSIPPSTQQ